MPSSFMISQITPEGFSPAMRDKSTEASVCPARTSTPPLRARKRKHVAGAREVLRPSLRVDGGQNGDGAVRGADAGGDADARVDGFAEGGAVHAKC